MEQLVHDRANLRGVGRLEKIASAPIVDARCGSSGSVKLAVYRTNGTVLVAGSRRSSMQRRNPSITGIDPSEMTRSHGLSRSDRRASAPLAASTVS